MRFDMEDYNKLKEIINSVFMMILIISGVILASKMLDIMNGVAVK